ncbi:unnamed protein product [Peronospora farinosa]|uniref:Kinesin motor domain-containing protein n=1 Tax=Peronospora farinosa TaxID=134698 RepID=A0AAV0ST96_9STRA|nr:unnamed protein product [Peronospora farinosa]CAI5707310.1 unnamed protein product [Peronospora farinosa]
MDQDANVKVFCRVRPPNERERGLNTTNISSSAGFFSRNNVAASSTSFTKKCVTVSASDSAQQTIFLHRKHASTKTFTFDRVFHEGASQNDVFEVVGAPITQACLEGYNGTIFAYGQTGSGKTFTMQGPDNVIDTMETQNFTQKEELSLRGLVPRVFDYLFDTVMGKEKTNTVQYTFACSFLEIYNERVYDLLDGGSTKDPTGLQLRENGRKGVHVEGLIESVVTNSKQAAELMTIGAQNRRVGQTSMNRESSRSHSVFILQLQSKEVTPEGTKIRTSRFNLVDLAGSERQRSTDAAGERLKEAGNINKSLSALGNVILGLSEQSVGKHRHVHYRDSKLTFLLKDSLGGNSKTFMIATISPAEDSAFETLSTLKFAQRAKMIQNSAVINEDSVGSALLLQEEIQRLRRQLQLQKTQQKISPDIRGCSLLLQQGGTLSDITSSQDSVAPSSQQYGPYDPVTDTRFRELEESFATTAEKNDRLLRSCEFLQLQNGNFQALCADLKQSVAQLKMMLRLRGIGGTEVHEYKPSADAIEWRMKYEEMEERVVELQDKLQCNGIEDTGIAEKVNSEVENVNMMLLTLTKQLAFVLREKHDLQDRLLENQADKDKSSVGLFSQEVVDADFSARLEESLKQQASEYQAKVDSAASVNAVLEEKVAETSLELFQMKELKASWSVQQHDLERRLADSTAALQNLEEAQCATKRLLVEEKTRAEKLQIQLDRVHHSAQLKLEAALADRATANQSLEHSNTLLMHQLAAANRDLLQRECQVQNADDELARVKVEVSKLEEANQRTLLEVSDTRDELKKTVLQTVHLQAKIVECESVIDEQKRSEAVVIVEKNILEQKLEEFSQSLRQMQEDACATAQNHTEAIESLKRHAQEEEQMLIEDFKEKFRLKDEKLQQLRSDFDIYRAGAEEADRLHSLMLKEKDLSLTVLQQQLDDQKQESQLALGDVQQKLSKTLADLSQLFEEKNKVEIDRVAAMHEIEDLQDGMKKLQTEKDAMTGKIHSLLQHSKELQVKTKELDDQNAELLERCDLQQAQLSSSEVNINRLTQEVEELQQQIVLRSNEVASLYKDLALARDDCRQAAITHSQQRDELASNAKKIEEQQQKLAESLDIVKDMTNKLEKTSIAIRDAEGIISSQREEIKLYRETQSTLRDELKNLEFDRLKVAKALKIEQEFRQSIEKDFAKAREVWMSEKSELEQHSSASILALEKRVDELALSEKTLISLKHELEQETVSLKTSVAEQVRKIQQLQDRVTDRENKIIVLESNTTSSAATKEKQASTIAELQNSVRGLESQLTKQEAKLAEKTIAITEKDDTIATLRDRVHDDEVEWDLKTREYKAELGAAHGQVQAFEQLVAEKTAAFAKAEGSFLTEKYLLEQKLEEGEEILAQQTEQLMQEIKQLEATVGQKDEQIEFANKTLAEFKDRVAQSDNSVKVKDLQGAIEELEAKHKSVQLENADLKKEAVFKLKEQEDELNRRRSALDVAEEEMKSLQKALEAQKASAENALKEVKAATAAQDVNGQAKRKFLAEKVKMQREIQTLTKKVGMLSKENEKLVGHHNSRQKIQHHVKVKEENNRLLDQVRLLTDDKLKLQRSLKKLQTMLKEKENIVGPTSNTPPTVSPISNTSSSGSIPVMKVKRPSLGSASSATAGTAASAAREAAKLAARGGSISRSASPGPTKKRARSHISSSGPGWQN